LKIYSSSYIQTVKNAISQQWLTARHEICRDDAEKGIRKTIGRKI